MPLISFAKFRINQVIQTLFSAVSAKVLPAPSPAAELDTEKLNTHKNRQNFKYQTKGFGFIADQTHVDDHYLLFTVSHDYIKLKS